MYCDNNYKERASIYWNVFSKTDETCVKQKLF